MIHDDVEYLNVVIESAGFIVGHHIIIRDEVTDRCMNEVQVFGLAGGEVVQELQKR